MAHTENGRDDVRGPAVFTGGKEPALGLPHKGEPAVARGGLRRKLAKSLAEGGAVYRRSVSPSRWLLASSF